jgi:hypothetical protein
LVVPSPIGNLGLLISADIQGTSFAALRLMLVSTLKAHLVMLPTFWGPNPGSSFFKAFAAKYKVYLAAANTTSGGGAGGGIYDPNGLPLAEKVSSQPSVVVATVPTAGSPVPPPPISNAKVVITELLVDPDASTDTAGEWIELFNAGTTTVDLNGWTLQTTTTSHTVNKSVLIAPGKYAVLAASGTTSSNGGVTPAYVYSSVSLVNGGTTVTLLDEKYALVDQLTYGSGWPVAAGASMSLKSPSLDNSLAGNWCKETVAWPGSAGDKGTPGAPAGCK